MSSGKSHKHGKGKKPTPSFISDRNIQALFCMIVARERLPCYSVNAMVSAHQAFNSSAASALVRIENLSNLQKLPDPPQIRVQRIKHQLEKLADELETGLSEAKRVLEESPSLAALQGLEATVCSLQEQYQACLDRRRKESGQELIPSRLWRRLENVEQVLMRLYYDVCTRLEDVQDVEDFRTAKEEWERDGKQTIPWEKIKADLGL